MTTVFESQPTPFDLRWRMLGTDVRVHPLFWVFSAVLGWDAQRPQFTLIWVLCVFVSILLHEFGHVLMGRLFGSQGHILLYSFGGLAIGATGRTRWQRILVLAAGPGIQMLLWGVIVACNPDLLKRGGRVGFQPTPAEAALGMLYYINLYWALLNLLPIWPLDGGQITGQVFQAIWKVRGLVYALLLSAIIASVLAVHCLMGVRSPLSPYLPIGGGMYLGLLFAMLAVGSFQLWAAENQRVNSSSRYEDERLPWE